MRSATYWKKSLHMALSPPLRFKHRMLLSAASWHGSKYSLYALLLLTVSLFARCSYEPVCVLVELGGGRT